MSSNPTEAALQDARAAYDAAPDHRPGSTSRKTMEARKALDAARIAYANASLDEIDAMLAPTPPWVSVMGRTWEE